MPLSPRPRARVCLARAQRLQLYESHATPKLYACYVKYSAPGGAAQAEMLSPVGSSFEVAFSVFKQFFLLKTKKSWDERFVRANMGDDAFTYTPPKDGSPQGVTLDVTLEM